MNANDATGDNIVLAGASHWRLAFPFAPDIESVEDAAHLLGELTGLQAKALARSTASRPDGYLVCSTVLSGICPQAVRGEWIMDGIEAAAGTRPLSFLRAYECSGWGFALRFFARNTGCRRVMISIVDADLHRSSILGGDEHWGRSGFGVTALLLDIPDSRQPSLTIGRSERRAGTWGSDTRAFASLVQAIRQRRDSMRTEMVFVHFMVKHIRGALERIAGTDRISPNYFNELGHCFGADPWIGIIKRYAAEPPAAPAPVTVASLSNNGYYTLCDVDVLSDARLEFAELHGDRAELKAMAAQCAGVESMTVKRQGGAPETADATPSERILQHVD